MKIVYLIVAHNRFDQLARLVHRIQAENVHILIHIDAKVSKDQFGSLNDLLSTYKNITYMERLSLVWGGFGLAEVPLNAMHYIVDNDIPCDVFYPLSGQDYPIKPHAEIVSTLAQFQGKQLVEYFEVPHSGWGREKGKDRYERFHVWIRGQRFAYPPYEYTKKHELAYRLLPKIRRRVPGNLEMYGGSGWMVLSRNGVEYLSRYFRTTQGERLLEFFKRTFAAEEMMYQTVLVNSEKMKPTLVNDNYKYIDFPVGDARPRTLTMADTEILANAHQLFARKFAAEIDADILDYIDEHLLHISADTRQNS